MQPTVPVFQPQNSQPSFDASPTRLEACDVCGKAALDPWLEVSLCGVLDRWIYRCGSCGFRQVRPRLDRDELAGLYPADYFDSSGSIGYGDYAREAQRRARDAYFIAKRLKARAPSGRVLEVGCALGFLLVALRHAGFDVEGVDASPFAAYYADTRFHLMVTGGTLEDAQFPDEQFDLVVQKDLLEHVLSPRRHLLDTCRVMRPNAELWLVTPNGEANLRPLDALRRSQSSSADGLPLLDQGHLSFFSEAHLRRLFDECGFTVEQARAIGVRRGLRALGILPGQRRFSRLASRVTQSSLEPELSTDGQMEGQFRLQATRIDAEVARHRSRVRSWTAYYYLHRFGKLLDTLPASSGLGYDFEFTLRKRRA